MDEFRQKKEDKKQRTIALAASEIKQLRENVTSLRCEIEKIEISKEDAIQKAVSTQQR